MKVEKTFTYSEETTHKEVLELSRQVHPQMCCRAITCLWLLAYYRPGNYLRWFFAPSERHHEVYLSPSSKQIKSNSCYHLKIQWYYVSLSQTDIEYKPSNSNLTVTIIYFILSNNPNTNRGKFLHPPQSAGKHMSFAQWLQWSPFFSFLIG